MTFTPLIVGTGTVAYSFLEKTRTQQIERLKVDPQIARDVAYFKENIGKVTSSEGLLKDRTLLKVALANFGLDEDINNGAFLRKVLESDLTDRTSFARRLADRRYFEFASAFNFQSGVAKLPGEDNTAEISTALQRVRDPDQLFTIRFRNLLNTALEAFGLTDQKDQTGFLKNILKSDVRDENSLVNRLKDTRLLAFAQAFQGVSSPVSQSFLDKFDTDTAAQLSTITNADSLLNDRRTFNKVVKTLGIEQFAGNTLFLKLVMESDLSDPRSIANKSGNAGLQELAQAFDFNAQANANVTLEDFARTFDRRAEDLARAEDLVDDANLLADALGVFGLDKDAKAKDRDFLISVLNSDVTDEASVARQESDPRYLALSKAFGFGEMLAGERREDAQRNMLAMIDVVRTKTDRADTADEFLADISLQFTVMRFFDIELDAEGFRSIRSIVQSDPSQSDTLFGIISDPRYKSFYEALDLQEENASFQYPANFTQVYTDNYIKSEFEERVGEQDINLRIAISLEDELETLISRSSTDTARWLSVLGSGPLRAALEGALGLPQGLAGLDPDRQVAEMQARAKQLFGTSEIEQLASSANIGALRERFLNSTLLSGQTSSSAVNSQVAAFNGALQILRGA